jgi:hypothetical protein
MFPRVYMDNTKRDAAPDRVNQALGAGHLMSRLQRYRRHISKETKQPTVPEHDENSHGADAWGGLAEIVDQIRNDGELRIPELPGFTNADPSMGMLG